MDAAAAGGRACGAGGASVALAASPAPAEGENGMVVTAQHLASRIGVDILKNGGNAVDAAVAVGYALAVVYPTAGNLGGGGFMTIRLKDGKTTFLDFRERAPLASTKTMYLDKDGNPIPGASTDGYLAVGVPGSVAGFEIAREKYGSKPREELLGAGDQAGKGRLRARARRRRLFRRRQRHAGTGPGGVENLPEGRQAAGTWREAACRPILPSRFRLSPNVALTLSTRAR